MASDSVKNASVREDQLPFMRGIAAGSVFLLLVALLSVHGSIPTPKSHVFSGKNQRLLFSRFSAYHSEMTTNTDQVKRPLIYFKE